MDFKHLVKITHRVASLLTFITTALLLSSFIFSFDMINGYFTDGILPILFNIFLIIGILASFACSFVFRKGEIVKTENSDKLQKIAAAFIAGALIIASFSYRVTIGKTSLAIIGVLFFAMFTAISSNRGQYTYNWVKIVCLLLSSLFPLIMSIQNNSVMLRHSNSVENMLSSVFGIAFLIYILYEGNRIFKGEHSKWHYASMLLLTHTGFSLSISYIVVYLMGIATESTRFSQMIIVFIISIFVEIELIFFTRSSISHTKEERSETEAPSEDNSNEEKTDV